MQTTVLSTLYTLQWRKRDFQFNNCLQETGRTPNFLCNMIKFNWSVRGYFIAFINGQKEWKWGLQSIPLLTCRLSGGELRGELDYRVGERGPSFLINLWNLNCILVFLNCISRPHFVFLLI